MSRLLPGQMSPALIRQICPMITSRSGLGRLGSLVTVDWPASDTPANAAEASTHVPTCSCALVSAPRPQRCTRVTARAAAPASAAARCAQLLRRWTAAAAAAPG